MDRDPSNLYRVIKKSFHLLINAFIKVLNIISHGWLMTKININFKEGSKFHSSLRFEMLVAVQS